jgi:hypothetical protein
MSSPLPVVNPLSGGSVGGLLHDDNTTAALHWLHDFGNRFLEIAVGTWGQLGNGTIVFRTLVVGIIVWVSLGCHSAGLMVSSEAN